MAISVITTTYNCGEYISEAIKSILNQTYGDFEYLVIDDGSTDDTYEVVSRFKDERIKYIKIEHIGRSKALNFALRTANNDIIALMDADDISHPLRFEKQLKHYSKPNQFIFSNTAYFKKNKIKFIIETNENENYNKKLILHGHFNNSSSIFNRNHVLDFGGFNENLYEYEDYELWLRVKSKSSFKIIPGIYHFVRLREDSMTTSNPRRFKQILYSIQEPYFNALSDFEITSKSEQLILMGWREFFYGSLETSREIWSKLDHSNKNIKLILAYLLSYFPQSFVSFLLTKRVLLKLKYFLRSFELPNEIQSEFKRILSEVSK